MSTVKSVSACCLRWVRIFSRMISRARSPSFAFVTRTVELMPRICVISISMDASSASSATVVGFMTFVPLPSPSP